MSTATDALSDQDIRTITDARHEGLKQKWKALKLALSPDNECFQMDEWDVIDRELSPPKVEAKQPDLPPAWPESFPDDPPSVVRAVVTQKFRNPRLWQIMLPSATGRPGDLANLWAKADTVLKENWMIYVRPNPNLGDGGYVLHGEYNLWGQRFPEK